MNLSCTVKKIWVNLVRTALLILPMAAFGDQHRPAPKPVAMPEYWGIAESLVFIALVLGALGATIRLGLLRSHLFQGLKKH